MLKKLSLIGTLLSISINSSAITFDDKQSFCELKAQSAQDTVFNNLKAKYWNNKDGVSAVLRKLDQKLGHNTSYIAYKTDDFAFSAMSIIGDLIFLEMNGVSPNLNDVEIDPKVQKYAEEKFSKNDIFINAAANEQDKKFKQYFMQYLTSFTAGKNLKTQNDYNSFFANNFEGKNVFQADTLSIYGVQPIEKSLWLPSLNTDNTKCDANTPTSNDCNKLMKQYPFDIRVGMIKDHEAGSQTSIYKVAVNINGKNETYNDLKALFLMSDPECGKLFKHKKGVDSVNGGSLKLVVKKSIEDLKQLSVDKSILPKTPSHKAQSSLRKEQSSSKTMRND